MSLVTGTRLGQYEIVHRLGAGGMGEVYRARDTRLGRDVALKILPESLAHDAERLARFRREAQVLAALNHPHIAGIYGLEEANGIHFLALELVEGETLAGRIEQGPLPVPKAFAIAREIAAALETAHGKGIVHRDLKPSNIALTADDDVKVLDFGLARAIANDTGPSAPDPTNSPTITSPATLTGMGVILGTAAYMSPEQARGRTADKRSDVWAFGCVLYEMLTGRRPFEGEDVSDTLAAVLRSEPDWTALPSSLSPAVRALIEGCLEKDRAKRIGDMSTARFVLGQSAIVPEVVPSAARSASSRWTWAVFLVAAAAIGAAAALVWTREPAPFLPVTRFTIPVAQGRLVLARRAVTISPDGTRIVYSADGQLYLRTLGDFEPRPIPGADQALEPEFSPDGQSIVFWSVSGLKRIGVAGGVPVAVCETLPAPFGISWDDHGIIFVQPGKGIMRVPPDGGTPATLVPLTAADGLVQGARLLPDGDTLIFTVARGQALASDLWDKSAQVVAHSLRTGERKTLIDGGSDARYVSTGHLVYALEGTIMAVPFDLQKREILGSPVPVVDGVRRSAASVGGEASLAFSRSGTLVYVPGSPRAGYDDLFLYDRKGRAEPLKLPRATYAYPRVSPDGKWLAFQSTEGNEAIVSLYELSGASSIRRLTFGGNNRLPIWTADGKRVAFQSDREGDRAVFWQPVDGGVAERLTTPEQGTTHVPESWSPQRDVFLFSVTRGNTISLWAFSLHDRKAVRFGDVTSAVPTNAVFSLDGRWVAYQASDTPSGESTTFVQPFPPTGTKFQIARGGRPLWSRDGKELLFVPAPNQFMAVSVRTEPTFTFTPPVSIPRRFGLAPPASPRPYDMLPDGRIVAPDRADRAEDPASPQIHVVQNWFAELTRQLPRGK